MGNYVIEAQNLRKYFLIKTGFFESIMKSKIPYVRAVDKINLEIQEGEIYGLAGESGSGKTTTGRLLLNLIEPTKGRIFFRGSDIAEMSKKEFKNLRRKMQIIFQDPYESLNPRMTVSSIIEEPLLIQGIIGKEIEDKVYKALEDVQMIPPEEFLLRLPHELSGGQRQRVAAARALVLEPEFIVADEPVSMLDVSIRAEVLNLMTDLRDKYNVSFLYITHDLALTRHICDRISIMYLGKIVEKGSIDDVMVNPLHPYTKALIAAVPVPDPTSKRAETVLKGEIPSPINPPPGCRFHTRCPVIKGEICRSKQPQFVEAEKNHHVACHLYNK